MSSVVQVSASPPLLPLVVPSLLTLGACASVDFDAPRTESRAYEKTGDTQLGRGIGSLEPPGEHDSGFYLLADGVDALATRLMMAEAAERSIDAQYYLIHDGVAARLFVDALLDAADRGVRVRLLLDDFLTHGLDDALRAFDAHPNVEVRLFNPFANRRLRFLELPSFRRVNRRMHNKSFVADNQAMVIGGRNIGDEYFGAREDVNFGDLDVFGVGPVVREVSAMFDAYWNSDRSLPLAAVVDAVEDPAGELARLRALLDRSREEAAGTRYGEVLTSRILHELRDEAELTWCGYELVHDSPDKAHASRAREAASILKPLGRTIGDARRELLVVSPYFVPTRATRHEIRDLVARGVETTVVTNSLAANNHTMVHAGYAPSRRYLVEDGVRLYEVRADRSLGGLDRFGHEGSRSTLHAKTFVVDREHLFLGSFNFDPRSAFLNTEMGIILDAPDLASRVVDGIEAALPERAYRVRADGYHRLSWTKVEGDREILLASEPDTSFWRRLSAALMELLPISGQL